MSRLIRAVEDVLPDFVGKAFSADVAAEMRESLMVSLRPEVPGLKDIRVSMPDSSALLLAVKADKCYDVTVKFPRCGLELSACLSQNSPSI